MMNEGLVTVEVKNLFPGVEWGDRDPELFSMRQWSQPEKVLSFKSKFSSVQQAYLKSDLEASFSDDHEQCRIPEENLNDFEAWIKFTYLSAKGTELDPSSCFLLSQRLTQQHQSGIEPPLLIGDLCHINSRPFGDMERVTTTDGPSGKRVQLVQHWLITFNNLDLFEKFLKAKAIQRIVREEIKVVEAAGTSGCTGQSHSVGDVFAV